ncbi:MAG TPA: 2-dehydropantoate 2-reductase [Bacillota bacterium]
MNIGIIGGGSVGLLVSSYLSKEHEVTIYVRREEQKKHLEEKGLRLTNDSSTSFITPSLLEELDQQDVLFICVKQYHLSDVIPIINETNGQTPLVFLQNGMGHLEVVQNLRQPVFIGVVEHGALRQNDYTVSHTGKGSIKLASLQQTDQLQELVEIFHQVDFPFLTASDWEKLLLGKLFINAVINPLTAIFDVPNGELLKNKYIRKLAKQICYETATTFGYDGEKQWLRVKEVATNTQENISSMLKDLRENRLTEIEAILGYVIKQHSSRERIPFTSFAYNGVKALEVKRGLHLT